MSSDPIETLLNEIKTESAVLGISLEHALTEKARELSLRVFLRCLPNDTIKTSRIAEFIAESLGREPSSALIEKVSTEQRGSVLEEAEYLELESSQLGRCALCGVTLTPSARPRVDHIVPVALGGKSNLTNYQLLCHQCNQGKSKLIGWIMGAPFLDEGQSYKLRYCVLTRDSAKCTDDDCTNTSRHSLLEILPIIPVQRGGRWIFDNLRTLCTEHAEAYRKGWKTEALAHFQSRKFGGFNNRWRTT
ncbi:HNH endonuclease [Myxococcus llanfairpwllgwyngyllgogerychwyrndrobwllllantysiliogogogochensis]|uniref:HNH endonuclease n=1 Tax=Myxococcus llanfairpwllgwyngyllgogerychwyrndrobwllllantysiliogogogochensis TaxID=2590453 RepID=A0A540WUQ2_9BACT|nr:HNH endonuclease [Myxococcus llanfairpwllgwyngyllgogerychwyrndrobwllllantysiliogogogochensis]